MRKLYTTKLISRPEMKFYLVLDYTLPSTWLKSTQAEIQNDGGSLGLVISLKTRSRLSPDSIKHNPKNHLSIHKFTHRALWSDSICEPITGGKSETTNVWKHYRLSNQHNCGRITDLEINSIIFRYVLPDKHYFV